MNENNNNTNNNTNVNNNINTVNDSVNINVNNSTINTTNGNTDFNNVENNNSDNVNKIQLTTCTRCGKQYDIRFRCCLDCGNINPDHPANADLLKLIKKYSKKNKKNEITSGLGNNMGNRKYFIIFNSIVFGLVILFSLIIPLINLKQFTLVSILESEIPTISILVGFLELLFLSTQIVFMKANHKWWHALIPFYSMYELCDIVFENGLYFILNFIPGVNIVFSFILYFKLGRKFDKNPILFTLFPFIYFPIVAFTSCAFDGIYYIDTHESNSVEKSYKTHNTFGHICLGLIIFGLCGLFYTYIIVDKVYLDAMKSILDIRINNKIDKIDKSIDSDSYLCSSSYTKALVDIKGDGEYYFYDEEFFDTTLLYSKGIGYIKLVIKDGTRKYYVSYSDNNFIIKNNLNTNLDILSNDKEEKIKNPEGVICHIEK